MKGVSLKASWFPRRGCEDTQLLLCPSVAMADPRVNAPVYFTLRLIYKCSHQHHPRGGWKPPKHNVPWQTSVGLHGELHFSFCSLVMLPVSKRHNTCKPILLCWLFNQHNRVSVRWTVKTSVSVQAAASSYFQTLVSRLFNTNIILRLECGLCNLFCTYFHFLPFASFMKYFHEGNL